MFTLREGHDSDLLFIGGGAGMAPILSLLRSMAERGITRRATYYYEAPAAATCASRRNCGRWRARCQTSATSTLSEPEDDDDWDGEVGLITDVVARHEWT